MTKLLINNLVMAAALLLAAAPAWANQILAMADEAETIVIGEGIAPVFKADEPIEFSVHADSVLKGQATVGSTLKAIYPKPNRAFAGQIEFEKEAPFSDAYGVWFFNGNVASFVRLPKSWMAPRGVSVEQLLLNAVVESYRHSISDANLVQRGESRYAEMRLRNSLQYAGRFGAEKIAIRVLEDLTDSASDEELEVALSAGVGMSQDSALARFGAELESLRSSGDQIGHILLALENSYTPMHGNAQLESLIRQNQKVRVPRMDAALAGALRRVSGKAQLELAALLLDSPDEQAVRRAAGFFYTYTIRAGKDGSVRTDGTDSGIHPHSNAETRAHKGHNQSLHASDLADFWRGWWADHQSSLI